MAVRVAIDELVLTDNEVRAIARYALNLQEIAAGAVREAIRSRQDSDDLVCSLNPIMMNHKLRQEITELKQELERTQWEWMFEDEPLSTKGMMRRL